MDFDKEITMSLKLVFSPVLNPAAVQMCKDYWSFANQGGYIRHVKALCKHYNVSEHFLFEILLHCRVYLNDVCCDSCGRPCQIEVPADIPYMRSQTYWLCEACERFSRGKAIIAK